LLSYRPDLTPLWGFVKDQVQSQRVSLLEELKTCIAAAVANATKDASHYIWQEDACKARGGAQCEVSHARQFFQLHIRNCLLMNKTLQATQLSYRYIKS
jgi:hypothetical protein